MSTSASTRPLPSPPQNGWANVLKECHQEAMSLKTLELANLDQKVQSLFTKMQPISIRINESQNDADLDFLKTQYYAVVTKVIQLVAARKNFMIIGPNGCPFLADLKFDKYEETIRDKTLAKLKDRLHSQFKGTDEGIVLGKKLSELSIKILKLQQETGSHSSQPEPTAKRKNGDENTSASNTKYEEVVEELTSRTRKGSLAESGKKSIKSQKKIDDLEKDLEKCKEERTGIETDLKDKEDAYVEENIGSVSARNSIAYFETACDFFNEVCKDSDHMKTVLLATGNVYLSNLIHKTHSDYLSTSPVADWYDVLDSGSANDWGKVLMTTRVRLAGYDLTKFSTPISWIQPRELEQFKSSLKNPGK